MKRMQDTQAQAAQKAQAQAKAPASQATSVSQAAQTTPAPAPAQAQAQASQAQAQAQAQAPTPQAAPAAGIGALIVAAGLSSRMGSFKPMLMLGRLSLVQRVIRTMREAGAGPIALVTGYEAARLEAHVADTGVVCLRNEAYATTQMLDSIKIGLRFLQDKCGRVLLTPADIPLYTAETVRTLAACGAPVAAPVYAGRRGHPLLLAGELIPYVEAYDGPGGLAGAIQAGGWTVAPVAVDDEGILLDADTPADFAAIKALYQRQQDCYNAP